MEDGMTPDWIAPDMPLGLPRGGDKDYYLGSPTVVEALIRNTLGKIYADREKAGEGGEPDNGPEFVQVLIEQAVQILLGRQNRYIPISDVWNADQPGAGIVRSVEAAYGLSGQTPAETLAFPFYMLLETAMQAEDLDAAGEDWEHLIDGDVEKMVAAFIGAPTEARV
jgi:hypothetical protein